MRPVVDRVAPGSLKMASQRITKMKAIYEARSNGTTVDFDTEAEAIEWIESCGFGQIVTFIRDFDGRERSCKLECFDSSEGGWRGVDISR
jgi:hypothetical protein